jgi:fructose-1,6-bisphosphatase I
LLDKVDAKNVFGKEQKGIDILANMFFHHALIDSNSCCLIVSSENVAPYIVPYEHAGPYCVAYYPLNGSSNLGCNISVGSIFGIWRRISDEDFLAKIDDILQSGNNLICSGYCMYSYSTEFIISYRTGLRKFQFDPLSMNFFLTSCHCKIMNPPQLYYSINEVISLRLEFEH